MDLRLRFTKWTLSFMLDSTSNNASIFKDQSLAFRGSWILFLSIICYLSKITIKMTIWFISFYFIEIYLFPQFSIILLLIRKSSRQMIEIAVNHWMEDIFFPWLLVKLITDVYITKLDRTYFQKIFCMVHRPIVQLIWGLSLHITWCKPGKQQNHISKIKQCTSNSKTFFK